MGRITLSDIKREVCRHYDISRDEIEGRSRVRLYSRPRQIAMSISRDMTNHSLPAIAGHYGNRDHTTALFACTRISELRRGDELFDDDYSNLKWAIAYRTSEIIGVGWRHAKALEMAA